MVLDSLGDAKFMWMTSHNEVIVLYRMTYVTILVFCAMFHVHGIYTTSFIKIHFLKDLNRNFDFFESGS